MAGDGLRALLMLNVAGDPNPLHNLGDGPMLDRITAALVVVGIALTVARLQRPEPVC